MEPSKKKDCSPCHNIRNMHLKISSLHRLLDFRNCKLYKIGNKDLVTQDNDFQMATGNAFGIIGYDSRISKATDKQHLPVPTTLLTNPISSYCTYPKKIMFVLQKETSETIYKKIIYEIKTGLFEQEFAHLPPKVKELCEVSCS